MPLVELAKAEPTATVPRAVTPAAVSSPGPAATHATDAIAHPSRRRGRLWVAAVLVLVLLAGGGAAAVVLLGGDDPAPDRAGDDVGTGQQDDPGDPGDGDISDEEPAATAPVETVTVTATPEPETTPIPPAVSPSAKPTVVECWNGVEADSISGCDPEVTGLRGLRWVFEGFDFAGENCSSVPRRLPAARRDQYQCPYDGTDRVRFNFSEFDTNRAGYEYYGESSGVAPVGTRDLLRWDYYTGTEFKTALLYRNGRWGVTVYSTDRQLRNDTVRNLVRRARAASDLRGIVTR